MEEQLKIDFEKLLKKSNFSKKNVEIKRKSINESVGAKNHNISDRKISRT